MFNLVFNVLKRKKYYFITVHRFCCVNLNVFERYGGLNLLWINCYLLHEFDLHVLLNHLSNSQTKLNPLNQTICLDSFVYPNWISNAKYFMMHRVWRIGGNRWDLRYNKFYTVSQAELFWDFSNFKSCFCVEWGRKKTLLKKMYDIILIKNSLFQDW